MSDEIQSADEPPALPGEPLAGHTITRRPVLQAGVSAVASSMLPATAIVATAAIATSAAPVEAVAAASACPLELLQAVWQAWKQHRATATRMGYYPLYSLLKDPNGFAPAPEAAGHLQHYIQGSLDDAEFRNSLRPTLNALYHEATWQALWEQAEKQPPLPPNSAFLAMLKEINSGELSPTEEIRVLQIDGKAIELSVNQYGHPRLCIPSEDNWGRFQAHGSGIWIPDLQVIVTKKGRESLKRFADKLDDPAAKRSIYKLLTAPDATPISYEDHGLGLGLEKIKTFGELRHDLFYSEHSPASWFIKHGLSPDNGLPLQNKLPSPQEEKRLIAQWNHATGLGWKAVHDQTGPYFEAVVEDIRHRRGMSGIQVPEYLPVAEYRDAFEIASWLKEKALAQGDPAYRVEAREIPHGDGSNTSDLILRIPAQLFTPEYAGHVREMRAEHATSREEWDNKHYWRAAAEHTTRQLEAATEARDRQHLTRVQERIELRLSAPPAPTHAERFAAVEEKKQHAATPGR